MGRGRYLVLAVLLISPDRLEHILIDWVCAANQSVVIHAGCDLVYFAVVDVDDDDDDDAKLGHIVALERHVWRY